MSDVDIALLFHHDLSDEQVDKLELSIWQKLTAILRTDEIDLLVLNNAPLSIRLRSFGQEKRSVTMTIISASISK